MSLLQRPTVCRAVLARVEPGGQLFLALSSLWDTVWNTAPSWGLSKTLPKQIYRGPQVIRAQEQPPVLSLRGDWDKSGLSSLEKDNPTAVYSYVLGGYGEVGARLCLLPLILSWYKSELCNSKQVMLFFIIWRVIKYWTGCPERWWSLSPWSYSALCWQSPEATHSNWTCFEHEVGLDHHQKPFQIALWFLYTWKWNKR